jgi:hypothetical protein
LGLTPLYLLCDEGFKEQKPRQPEEENTKVLEDLFENEGELIGEKNANDISYIERLVRRANKNYKIGDVT